MEEFKQFITELCAISAREIVPFFAHPDLVVETKSNATPVTIADKRAEEVIRELIESRYPHHGIIGEEFGSVRTNAEYVWTLDPIDGTISFATACPLFGTMIGLLHNGRPVLGAVNQPILRQLLIGDGETTTMNGRPFRMRDRTLSEATLLATDIRSIGEFHSADRFQKLCGKTRIFRTWGDCYGYLLLATGWADIMLDARMNIWDVVPLVPIIEGAGGVITDWHGGDAATGVSCIAANPVLHRQVLAILNG